MGATYKPVAKKILPVATYDLEASVPSDEPIVIGDREPLPIEPIGFENFEYTGRLMKEQMAKIISHVPAGFLTKPELDLLAHIHILKQEEDIIAFTNSE